MDIAAESVGPFPSYFPALKKNQTVPAALLVGYNIGKGHQRAALALRLQVEGFNLRAAIKRLSWDCRPEQGFCQSTTGWEIILPHLILAKAHT